jgi:hypothetical protein
VIVGLIVLADEETELGEGVGALQPDVLEGLLGGELDRYIVGLAVRDPA